MFDNLSAADLVDVMSAATRAESVAIAQRLAAVAELHARRTREFETRQLWLADSVTAVTAEVSAAQNISRARAFNQVHTAAALHSRFPKVAAVFITGAIDYRMVSTVIARTDNVEDEALPALDDALASRVSGWMRLSKRNLRDRLDHWVATFDAAGVRVPPTADEGHYVDIEQVVPGTATISAALHTTDAAAFDKRLNALADTVCDRDPRTRAQRRAAAFGALGRHEASLACMCDDPDCPAAALKESAAKLVIHLLAEQATLDGTSEAPGYLSGFGVLPADSVRRAAEGAVVTPVVGPGTSPDPAYRPPAKLADFLRWRDLTCRFPGCDAPVAVCDVDHSLPWPFGATEAGNLKHFCRTHHLLKTFYTGPNGWTDRQLPDGTIEFRAPTGHTYTTEALGAELFSSLAAPTPATTSERSVRPDAGCASRSAMMPKRRRTRGQERAARIKQERQRRLDINAELERQHHVWLAATHEPPPF